MSHNEFTGAGARLLELKAETNAKLKKIEINEADLEDILGLGDSSSKPSSSKAKKPSPPKTRKLEEKKKKEKEVEEEDEDDVVLSDDDSNPDSVEGDSQILLSSDDDVEDVQTYRRKTKKENKNRVNFFRQKELDASFNEHQRILSYLDDARQQDFEANQRVYASNDQAAVNEEMLMAEINVKVRWNCGQVQRHKMRPLQPFRDLIKILAEQENISTDRVVLELEDKRVRSDDTPNSIGYNIGKIMEGSSLIKSTTEDGSEDDKKGRVEIKVQLKDRRASKISAFLLPEDPMLKLYVIVAEHLKVDVEKVRLRFDGEPVSRDETVADLDLDGGEVMDCTVVD